MYKSTVTTEIKRNNQDVMSVYNVDIVINGALAETNIYIQFTSKSAMQ